MPDQSLVDDATIANTSQLWRRVHPTWIVKDDNAGGMRLSSAAFDDSADGSPLSVLLAEVVFRANRVGKDVLSGYDGYALAAITAGTARTHGQGVAATPEPNEPAHASVFGPKTKSNKRGMARAAIWVIRPSS
jgi:hypothetical protein